MIYLMEFVGGFRLKDIFTANNNWAYFLQNTKTPIRPAIHANIMKLINCGSNAMGFHVYECKYCQHTKKVFHTCKSRFCSSCGKKATDAWISKHLTILPQTTYQHITFTFPKELQPLFWLNRHIINDMMRMPAQIITKLAKIFGVIAGVFVAIHTFGRDLKPNMHFHLSTTLSGLSLNKKQWMCYFRFNRPSLKKIKKLWRDGIIDLLQYDSYAKIPDFAWDSIAKIRTDILNFLTKFPKNNYVLTNCLEENLEDRELYEQVESMAIARNSLFVPVQLKISKEEHLKRLTKPERRKRWKSIDPQDAEDNDPLLSISHHNVIELEISNLSPQAAAEHIMNHIHVVGE